METTTLLRFMELAAYQAVALDRFVEAQRAVSGAVRARDWEGLAKAVERASARAADVNAVERDRRAAWEALVAEAGLTADASPYRASLAVPAEARMGFTDACRTLRLSVMRARIENESLAAFVDAQSSALSTVMEGLFPERKVKIYGKSGRTTAVESRPLVINAAL